MTCADLRGCLNTGEDCKDKSVDINDDDCNDEDDDVDYDESEYEYISDPDANYTKIS